MFYVSSYKDNLIGVTDSEDNVEEFYTKTYLEKLGVEIIRFNKELDLDFKFKTKCFEFTLVKEDSIKGWKLKALDGVSVFRNKDSYLGYPVISLKKCFRGYKGNILNVSQMDTSKVTDMSDMFWGCNLTSLDLSNFDTSNVIDMGCMFQRCNLTSLDLSNFDTSKVTNIGGMFDNCRNLISLDVSNFNTSKVIDMSYMFYSCHSLTSLDVSNFNTTNVTDMDSMFYGCNSLTSLDVSNFNTSKVTSMSCMFCDCRNLTTLDLSNFDTSNVTNMDAIFWSTNLRLIKIKDSKSKLIKQCDCFILVPIKQGGVYNCKIKIKKDTSLNSLVTKLLLTINNKEEIIGYEEVD